MTSIYSDSKRNKIIKIYELLNKKSNKKGLSTKEIADAIFYSKFIMYTLKEMESAKYIKHIKKGNKFIYKIAGELTMECCFLCKHFTNMELDGRGDCTALKHKVERCWHMCKYKPYKDRFERNIEKILVTKESR